MASAKPRGANHQRRRRNHEIYSAGGRNQERWACSNRRDAIDAARPLGCRNPEAQIGSGLAFGLFRVSLQPKGLVITHMFLRMFSDKIMSGDNSGQRPGLYQPRATPWVQRPERPKPCKGASFIALTGAGGCANEAGLWPASPISAHKPRALPLGWHD